VVDPHAPYHPPESTRKWFEAILLESAGPKWSDPIWLQGVRRALYDGEVASNDSALPELTQLLAELDLLDDTLIVLIADHGEHLGEHDLWDHIPPSYMQVVHVPLMMRLPARTARKMVVEQPVQLLDLMPTILDLAEIEISGLPLQGRSLVPLITGEEDEVSLEMAVVQEAMSYQRADDPQNVGSLIWDRWHFLHSDKAPSVLFDIRVDPEEAARLVPSRTFENQAMKLLRDLRYLDDEYRQAADSHSPDVVEINLDSIANLEALGYLDN
jgi:arylsulfatase A-like enzyme